MENSQNENQQENLNIPNIQQQTNQNTQQQNNQTNQNNASPSVPSGITILTQNYISEQIFSKILTK
jgi:hypothetical protein